MPEQTGADEILRGLHGRIRDTDAHEMIPARLWVEEFGEVARPFADLFIEHQPEDCPNSMSVRRLVDDGPVDAPMMVGQWGTGCNAAGAFDMRRRLCMMDATGIRDTMLFGSVIGLTGWQLATGTVRYFEHITGLSFGEMTRAIGRDLMAAHNDWCVRTSRLSPRFRPVASIVTETLSGALAAAGGLIADGIRAISIPSALAVDARAPAHPDNDPLWRLLADHDVTLVFHIGGEAGFLADKEVWLNAPLFSPNLTVAQEARIDLPMELTIDPVSFATCHMPVQNYLTNLVLGGVFERVPNLRVGVMELGAGWVGPMAEGLDVWAAQFKRRYKGVLSMPPSAYVLRNIRVSPFNFEPVARYMERFPDLAKILCFASDYPHQEGGPDPRRVMADELAALGSDVIEDYFVANADWIMPAARDALH